MSVTRVVCDFGSIVKMGCSFVSVVGSVDLLSVVRHGRTPTVVDREGFSVRFNLSLLDRDRFSVVISGVQDFTYLLRSYVSNVSYSLVLWGFSLFRSYYLGFLYL